MKKRVISAVFLGILLGSVCLHAQTLFRSFEGSRAPSDGEQKIKPDIYRLVAGDNNGLRQFLSGIGKDYDNAAIIDLPTPDGGFRSFRIWGNGLLPDALQSKFPAIKTFTAEAADDKTVTAKIDFTEFGFHAMIFDGNNTYLIDPYSDIADGYYTVYFKKDYKRSLNDRMHCDNELYEMTDADGNTAEQIDGTLPGIGAKQFGTLSRTYRLALSCTGEYAVAVAGANPTKSAVFSAMTTTMNRVNGIYEKEVGVTMNFIPNEDTLIYLNANTDPFSGNFNGNVLLTENPVNTRAVIGTVNYDIGHVFSTGGGGIAGLGVVCRATSNSDQKARGVTGASNPVGDSYDVDYVAHEMGHQFGGEHTFNSNLGACGGNNEPTSAYEPGSGTTIMAYAGICNSDDIQSHSNDYFHIRSLDQISDYITTGNGATCAVTSAGTVIPLFDAISATYNIPYKTPFELEAPVGVAAISDSVLYCWEEWDLGNLGNRELRSDTFTAGPAFRSFQPTKSSLRVFPAIEKVIANISAYVGERLPTVARTMNFKLAVRNTVNGIGSFNFSDDELVVNFINTGTPFAVTSPNLNTDSAKRNTSYTVTWDVAQTTAAPVSTANVDIFLSVDGGYTYPFTLATGVPNTGSASVLMPDTASTAARIKVKGSGNIFFDISNADFKLYGESVGVNEIALNNDVTIYPNPATNIINVISKGTHALRYELFNVIGQKITAGSVLKHSSIAVGACSKGIYYLKITDEESGATISKAVSIR